MIMMIMIFIAGNFKNDLMFEGWGFPLRRPGLNDDRATGQKSSLDPPQHCR